MEVGKRLKQLRKEKKLTLVNLSDIFNKQFDTKFTHSIISRWENSKYEISRDNLNYYSIFFGVSLDWLVNGSEPKYLRQEEKLDMIFTTKQENELNNWINTNILYFNSMNLSEKDKNEIIKIMKQSYIRSLKNKDK